MDFSFDINQVFSERVSILDHTLDAGRKSAGTPHRQAHIATVIDALGRASAKKQNPYSTSVHLFLFCGRGSINNPAILMERAVLFATSAHCGVDAAINFPQDTSSGLDITGRRSSLAEFQLP